MNSSIKIKSKILLTGLAFTLAGCMSGQNHPALDEAVHQATSAQSPIVEAYVEYAGPDEKWIGPSPVLLHVEAKDPAQAKFEVAGRAFKMPTPTQGGRLSTELTRDELLEFSVALEKQSGEFQGCLYPIRVRLIRASGAVIEKQGCRGQKGFSKLVSKRVNDWLNAAYYGVTPKTLLGGASKQPPPRTPASQSEETPKEEQ